jgi:hypothetical protein
MTNEKLIELAKAAGFYNQLDSEYPNWLRVAQGEADCSEELAKFAELVREDERKSKWLPISQPPDETDDWNNVCVAYHPDRATETMSYKTARRYGYTLYMPIMSPET